MHDGFARQHFKARKHRFGVFTGVGVNPSHQHIEALGTLFLHFLQHGVGFTHARRRPEKEL